MVQIDNSLQTYLSEISDWQQTMESNLRADNGWLTVVGLHWLNEGINTIGSASDSIAQLPDSAPEKLGVIEFSNRQAHLQVTTDEVVTIDAVPVKSILLRDDHAENGPSLIKVGSITFFVIRRGDQYGIRVRDSDSPALTAFGGRHWFPVDTSYKVPATFTPYPVSRTIQVVNSVGLVIPMENPGYVEFELHNQQLRLEAFEAGETQWWFIFKDGTSGSSTYGAGRFLYAPRGEDGTLWIDFNRAYHPPCAFTYYATCPLPPKENVLGIRIEAGERF
ncbi:MAG TPA: DUF1684 domain-containing protein [Phototrophicaceae bacterium]|nr:DUF1684 domain-containing protein [Phototrophicaceae bacterium]